MLSKIFSHIAYQPAAIALKSETCQISYQDLPLQIERVVDWLKSHQAHGTVALAVDNSSAWVITDLAMLSYGLTNVPIPAFFSDSQKQHVLDDARVSILITDQPVRWLQSDQERVVIGCLTVATKELFMVRINPDSLASNIHKITYTSGTTGQPKGVCLHEDTMWQVADAVCQVTGQSSADRHCCVLPLATLLENVAGVYGTLLAGGTVCVDSCERTGFSGGQFQVDVVYRTLVATAATTVIFIPELLKALTHHIETGYPAPAQLRFVAVGGASVASDFLLRAHHVGLPVYEGYGLSESASVVTLNTPQSNRPGSIGKPLPHIQMQVDASGELWIKGANFTSYTQSQSEPVTDSEGFMPTGDLAYRDDDGFWYVSGRKKNMFITSFGRNVSPEWVESELVNHTEILQACVFGEARPFNVAVIVAPAQLSSVRLDTLIMQTNARLPDYAQIADWIRATEPFTPLNQQLTTNGRVKRAQIWQSYQPVIEALYQEIV